jgi:DNA polymerase III delta subunit
LFPPFWVVKVPKNDYGEYMIIFLHGQDTYKISQKLKELVVGYKTKNPSGFNLINLDFSENSLQDFFEAVKSDSLFPKRIFGASESAGFRKKGGCYLGGDFFKKSG